MKPASVPTTENLPVAYWSQPTTSLLSALGSHQTGLSSAEAGERLKWYGPNTLTTASRSSSLRLLLGQFKSPLVLILIFAAVISATVQEWVDAVVVIAIVLGSALLGFFQEYSATHAVEKLRAQVSIRATVLRDGQPLAVPAAEVVPGDIVQLSAGSLIPADAVLIEATAFFVNEAVLTGETYPAEKSPGTVPTTAGLAARKNTVYMGTNVRSGMAQALVVQTGMATAFGQIAERLTLRPPETEFERGIRRFGVLLTQVMLALVLAVFAINVFAAKPAIDAFLFAIALAVGLAPELLPAIISVNLATGAQHMAAQGVIVRRLNAIENLGSMDVLCTDKTGTLTVGAVRLVGALDPLGRPAPEVLQAAFLNAALQTGLVNPLDAAIVAEGTAAGLSTGPARKVSEIPYDFVRKRLSVVVTDAGGGQRLITKGALNQVLAVCGAARVAGERRLLDAAMRAEIDRRYAEWGGQGLRVLGVAERPVSTTADQRAAEQDLEFIGFLRFFDPPKPDAAEAIANLAALGVQLKIITGDNQLVAADLAEAVGLPTANRLTGAQLNAMTDEALWQTAERTTLFAEVDPNQKERIVLALRKMGHVVGYMGDGINDAPALHAADVGLSVDSAVDVAKEAADFVLLKQDLVVLRQGIQEGRKTFANTLKYIFTTTSANFGNMFSMAGASLFLPFLPLLAKQILLNNFLSDIPAVTIAGDSVDAEWVARPRRWDIRFIRNFMVLFGLVSSVFDFLTFGVLLLVVRTGPAEFRTAWFIESLLTELAIALVVRTRRLFFRSRPSPWLLISTLTVSVFTLTLPYLPFSGYLGFVPLPASLVVFLIATTVMYVVAAEFAKKFFYAHAG